MDWRKKIWEDQDKKKEYDKNMAIAFRYSMALENYFDSTGNNKKIINNVWTKEAAVREAKFAEPEEKVVEMSAALVDEFKKVVDLIGKDKFVFYDEDDLEYVWKNSKEKNNGRK